MDALKRILLLSGILLLMPLSAFFASGASCDIAVSPEIADPNDLSQNPGRVTVFGEGGGSFSDSNSVQINCNVDGAQPGASQDLVKARIPAFSQSLLSYTGYCSYKTSSTDVAYKIGVTILPDNIACAKGANSYAAVTVKASSKAVVDTTCKSADEIYDTDYKKCVGCGDYGQNKCSDGKCRNGWKADARGKCTEKDRLEPIIKPPTQSVDKPPAQIPVQAIDEGQAKPEIDTSQAPRELRFGLDWKWSLISVPYGEISSEDHACLSKIYYYDKDAGKYRKVTDLKDKSLIGKGLWAKKTTGNKAGDCTIKYTGRFLSSQTISLKKGWNLVGIQTERSLDTTKTSCKITGGPFMYSGFLLDGKPQGYIKRDSLNYGTGYWVKVADDCKLSNEEEEEAPPAPPESDAQASGAQASAGSQTIEPQGTRGRRFIADAG